MTVIRYPAQQEGLVFTSSDEVFLDSSLILTSMIYSKDLNTMHSYANAVLNQLRELKIPLVINPTVYSEVVDNLLALLFGNDLILYARNEHEMSLYSDYELAKKCFNNHILSKSDIESLKSGHFKELQFKNYINEFNKNAKRKAWLINYYEPAVTLTNQYIWAYKIKTVSSIDEENKKTVGILAAMQGMKLRSHDALHFTTAVWHGCTYFLTTDEDYKINIFDGVISVLLITHKKQ